MVEELRSAVNTFNSLVRAHNTTEALSKLDAIKTKILSLDSLPPLGLPSPTAGAEFTLARDFLEHAVLLVVELGDKEGFQRYMSTLRPYYSSEGYEVAESENIYVILALNLLFLLVENRLSDFHSELELLSDEQHRHSAIVFCTQLDQHLMVGSYDQVLQAAANPPIDAFRFFLTSLLETVRVNIGECAVAAYTKLSLPAATELLMFTSQEDTLEFVAANHPEWVLVDGVFQMNTSKAVRSEGIPSLKLISQTLTYATELERIV